MPCIASTLMLGFKNRSCRCKETVTRDKGCYKTEASPAVSDKGGKDKRGGEEGGGLAQQEAEGEEGDVGENKPW